MGHKGRPEQTGSLLQACVWGWWHFAQALFPATPNDLGLTDPVLGSQFFYQGYDPKKH
jgi:hypothetical protein